jgi:hypothetical protein
MERWVAVGTFLILLFQGFGFFDPQASCFQEVINVFSEQFWVVSWLKSINHIVPIAPSDDCIYLSVASSLKLDFMADIF